MTFVLPLILGHRGARAVKTENTIEAFRYACQSGIRWVELDAMLSQDGQVMVFHDETLDRLSGVSVRLDKLTAEQLQKISLNPGGKIPTLAEVLDVLNEFRACVNIEIKPSRPDLARETARRVWQVVQEKGFDDPDRLVFSSFAWDSLEETALLAPQIRRGVLVEDISGDWRSAAKKVGAYSINYDADLLTEELIAEIKKGGYRLMAYTVNDPDQAKQLKALGVESFFCDDPAAMMKVLT
ncbi:MAG: hypothetical protein IJ752_05120 [Alphaproteobacteria bacterium]|nr:hypothetical protein [Alphaproteobacteria bacterium]